MIKEIIYKMFGIEPFPCPTCEVLQLQLENEQRRSQQLLNRLLEKDAPTGVAPEPVNLEDMQPLKPNYVPWRVRQQHLEAEDRAKAEVLRKNREEVEEAKKKLQSTQGVAEQQASIDKLEKELGIKEA